MPVTVCVNSPLETLCNFYLSFTLEKVISCTVPMRKCCDSCFCDPQALWTKTYVGWRVHCIILHSSTKSPQLSLYQFLREENVYFCGELVTISIMRSVVIGGAHGWDEDYIRAEEEQSGITWLNKPHVWTHPVSAGGIFPLWHTYCCLTVCEVYAATCWCLNSHEQTD